MLSRAPTRLSFFSFQFFSVFCSCYFLVQFLSYVLIMTWPSRICVVTVSYVIKPRANIIWI